MDKVAVFIDADNISAVHAGEIMKRAGKLGDVVICRAYGNCSGFTGEKSWKEGVRLFGIQAFPQISICDNKKNNADFALMLDAWETVLTDCVFAICIVSSDSDFLPLVQRIRPRMSVYGFGGEQTPMAYQMAFMRFFGARFSIFSLSLPSIESRLVWGCSGLVASQFLAITAFLWMAA